ncbi:MAG: hypothetical protein GXO25_01215 [Euryarchaeota archaeon]|nr:hypothetical protein [Euryarchaeota archaeon]
MISTKKAISAILFGILIIAGITIMATSESGVHKTTARYNKEFSVNSKMITYSKNTVEINHIHITAGISGKTAPQKRTVGATVGIRINNDSDLQNMAINEGWPGNGSATDPYIISNMSINANGGSSGIYIGNVTDHIIICNISVNGTLGFSNYYYHGDAIELYNTSNVYIDNVTVNNSQFGITLISSTNDTITHCSNIYNSEVYGIEILRSSNISIINNAFYKTSGNFSGIAIIYSTNNTLYNNSLTDNTIYVWGSESTFTTQTIPTNNTVNGGYVYYYKNEELSNITFPPYATEIILGNVTNAKITNTTALSVDIGYSHNISVFDNYMVYSKIGIYMEGVDNATISNNNCSDSMVGIAMYYSKDSVIQNNQIYTTHWDTALYLNESDNITVSRNNIANAYYQGIALEYCVKDTIENNKLIDNNNNGIYLYHSAENVIWNNNASDSKYYHGISIEASNNNTILNNSLWNNHYQGIWIGYSSGNNVSNNQITKNGYCGIFMYYSSNNTIINNDISESQQYHGISINYGDYNILANNTISNNQEDGIYIYTSNNTEITRNYIASNLNYGIYIGAGSYNLIYNNSFYYNNGSNGTYNSSHIQAYDDGTNNIWNSSTEGNYWYDWANNNNTNDQNHDGIVDWPYVIGGNANSEDYLPLKESNIYVPEFPNIAILLPLLALMIFVAMRRRTE